MSWITLTEAKVQDRLTADELDSLKTLSVSSGGAPLADVLSGVIGEVRGYVGAGGYTLGAGATIPEELLEAAVSIARYRLILRLPAEKLLMTPERVADKNAAVDLLKTLVARGKFGIVAPTTAATDQAGPAVPSFADKTLYFDKTSQDGT